MNKDAEVNKDVEELKNIGLILLFILFLGLSILITIKYKTELENKNDVIESLKESCAEIKESCAERDAIYRKSHEYQLKKYEEALLNEKKYCCTFFNYQDKKFEELSLFEKECLKLKLENEK